jgi:hypothetical protein
MKLLRHSQSRAGGRGGISNSDAWELGRQLTQSVLEPLTRALVGKWPSGQMAK